VSGRFARALALSICLGLAMLAVPAAAGSSLIPGPDPALEIADAWLTGSDGSWQADPQFRVGWKPLLPYIAGTVPPVLAYRVENDEGEPVGPVVHKDVSEQVLVIPVPAAGTGKPAPGVYRLSLWLERGSARGASRTLLLHLDNSRPATVQPLAPSGWLKEGSSVRLRIEHPGTPPPSGIRGYAVELDHGSGSEPCAGRPTCTNADVDLPGGEGDDSIVLGPLSEETNVARVVAVSGTGMRSAVAGAAVLRVDGTPPAVTISGVPRGWAKRPVELAAVASDPLSGMRAGGPAGPVTGIAVDGGAVDVSRGPRAVAIARGDGAHRIAAFGRDAVGNVGAADPAAARATVWIDETAPRIGFASRQDPAEPERIVARVDDPLSGPASSGGSIAIRPAGSGTPFEPLPTDVAGSRLIAHWDSDSYPRGSYEFRAIGFDLAGNRGQTRSRADGTPMVLTNPVKTAAALAFGFGGRRFVAHRCRRAGTGLRCHRRVIVAFGRRPARTGVGYGRGIPVSGRLTTAGGQPLGDLPVEVTETFAAGAEARRRTTTAVTGADGVFLAHLPPGPSRRIRVAFAGTRNLTFAVGRELWLDVRSRLHLRASSATATVGGAPVVFSGRLARRGAHVPPEGLPVALEFRLPGLPWTEFRTVQTDAHGRFRYPYAFSDNDSRGVRFQFRAQIARQPGWPYDAAHSLPVSVTGR